MLFQRSVGLSAIAVLACLTLGCATAQADPPAPAPQQAAAPAATSAQPAVEPAAREALRRMSAYLGTLQSFRVVADTSADRVYDNGQSLQFNGRVTYDVRRPNGFVIEMATDRHTRKLYYDGRSLTLFAPARGLYATVPAPNTISGTLDLAWQRHGISVPLEDLFRWSNSLDRRDEALNTGIWVGYARVNGVDTDQYAFQENGVDWQVWIRQGDRPVPVRVVVIDAVDPAHPQFVANLTWTENPSFSDSTFAFQPPAGAQRITFLESDD